MNSSNLIFFQTIRVAILLTISFLVSLLITPLCSKFLEKYGFKKTIRSSREAPIYSSLHQKKAGTLNAGGIIMFSAVIGLALFFFLISRFSDGFWHYFNFVDRAQTWLPLASFFLAASIGFVDDWVGIFGWRRSGGSGGLKVRNKLIIYSILAALGSWWFYFRLGWDVLNVPFLGNFQIGAWYIPLFMFVIVASAFSANETDGLDGLLGGVSLFAFGSLTVVAFVLHRYELAAFGGVVIGSLLAFLWYNIYPAKFFMGDTGSMSLGITLGVIAMLTNTALLLPLFVPILVVESLSVIIQLINKRIRGKKIFLSTPLHHHFEALGWPESQITMRFWIISAISSALGLVIFFLNRLL